MGRKIVSGKGIHGCQYEVWFEYFDCSLKTMKDQGKGVFVLKSFDSM